MLLIQDGNQAFFCQAALNQGGNNQAVTRDLSASRKWLVSCRVERNMTTKKGKHISTYSKIREEVSRDEKKKESSMAYGDNVNKLRKGLSIEGAPFINTYNGRQV